MLENPKIYDHIYPNLEDWPIYKMHADRDSFIQDLIKYTKERLYETYGRDISGILAKTHYAERIRVREDPWKADPANEGGYWSKFGSSLKRIKSLHNDEQVKEYDQLLTKIVHRYSEEIVGGFKKKTFLFSRKFLRVFFSRLLNAAAGRNQKRIWGTQHRVNEHLRVHGAVDKIRRLFDKGTVVILPTHSSNLDSILIGYAIDAMTGMPGYIYGAGLNLYDSETFSYFMNRLGAYRIDRRKKNPIYLQTLKSMSALGIEKGVNGIFFPGGTRSRNGEIEHKLKLGLLGTCVEAQRRIFQKGEKKKVFVVPLVLSSHCVLEANYLIDNHLSRSGKEKYFKSKDNFKSLRNIIRFLWRLFGNDSDIILNFGEPMDVFGNQLDENGESLINGKSVDIREYFLNTDSRLVTTNTQREHVYTQLLADKIAKKYKSENVVLSSHVVAFTAFKYLQNEYRDMDIYTLVSQPTDDFVFDRNKLLNGLSQVQARLVQMEENKEVILSNSLKNSVEELMETGMKKLGIFHVVKPITTNKNKELTSESFKLLYFYHNRLTCYELLDNIKWDKI